jgi:hypothetical protein
VSGVRPLRSSRLTSQGFGGECVDRATVKSVLLSHLNLSEQAYGLSVSPTSLPKAVLRLATPQLLASLSPPDHDDAACGGASRYNIYMTADGGKEGPAKQAMEGVDLREALQQQTQMQLCDVTVKKV